MGTSPLALVIHGGAEVRTPEEFEASPGLEDAYRQDLARSLDAGFRVLGAGGAAVVAVEAAIVVMEDSPLFNAGKGASLTRAGTVELDAAVMDGATMRAGAVAAVRHVRNPIALARRVMEQTPHVLLAGEGATAYAQTVGVPWVPDSYFHTEEKWEELVARLERDAPYGKELSREEMVRNAPPQDEHGDLCTVGAVALDSKGTLAAGTSTGGRITKMPGRVGDSPIIGAGTYANNEICAVSTTGLGEVQMVLLTAKEIACLMAYRRLPVEAAADLAVKEKLVALGGSGGAVVLDRQGALAMPYTTAGMYRGWVREDGRSQVMIHEH